MVATHRQIDAPAYEIYGLTDDEIALVEGFTGGGNPVETGAEEDSKTQSLSTKRGNDMLQRVAVMRLLAISGQPAANVRPAFWRGARSPTPHH